MLLYQDGLWSCLDQQQPGSDLAACRQARDLFEKLCPGVRTHPIPDWRIYVQYIYKRSHGDKIVQNRKLKVKNECTRKPKE
jgi:hypothetical protein